MFEGLVDKMITDSEPEYGIPQGMKTLLHAITESVGDVEENRANTVKV